MTLVLAAVAVAHLAAASPSPAPPQQAMVGRTARISGTVTSAADDAPLARARVVAVSPALPEPRVAITGSDGKYTLADLPPGGYTVTATRTGYAPLTYGQARAAIGTPVNVSTGQQVTAIDLPLVAGGVIAGRIFDEDGAAFAGAIVDALVTRYQDGREMLFSVASAQTDDRGEFRLFGLTPGAYYVSAGDPAFANLSTPTGVQHYSSTYYPGTSEADRARTVIVAAATPQRIEFKLQLVPPARVAGRLTSYDARPFANGAMVLTSIEGEGVPFVAPDAPELWPDGRFAFSGVAPGHYLIRARAQTDARSPALFALYSIEVAGDDIDGIRLTLRPGGTLDGAVTVESSSGAKPDLAALRVRAPLVDGSAFGDSLTGAVQTNGSFALRGVMKGDHQIVVDGLAEPWVLKSVFSRGTDITDLRLAVNDRDQIRDVRIVITDRASEVGGLVETARKRPVANTGVLICSSEPGYRLRTSRRLRLTFTDQNGRWHVAGLPPGEYFAVASPAVDESDLGRPQRLSALQAVGTAFRVDSDSARATLTLQLASIVAAPSAR